MTQLLRPLESLSALDRLKDGATMDDLAQYTLYVIGEYKECGARHGTLAAYFGSKAPDS